HHLALGDRRRHQHLDRAGLQLLGQEAHGQDRPDEEEDQPEEEGAAEEEGERRAARGARIRQERHDHGEDEAVDDQEEEEHHVGERREEVGAQLAVEGRPDAAHDTTSSVSGRASGGAAPSPGSPGSVVSGVSGVSGVARSWVVRRTKMSSSDAFWAASSRSTQERSTVALKTASRTSAARSASTTQAPGSVAGRTASTPGRAPNASATPSGAPLTVTRRVGFPTDRSRRSWGVPWATIRPRSRISTRLHSSSTSGRMWVERRRV